MPEAVLRPRKAKPFFARHPWVMSTAIDRVSQRIADGAEVDLVTDEGRWIARGIWNAQSHIRVRLYTWKEGETLDREFWRGRLATAIQLRRDLQLVDEDQACRLVFSEADGLSGLIVDRFGPHLVIQPTSRGVVDRLEMVAELLGELLSPASISVRIDPATQKHEGFEWSRPCVSGEVPTEPIRILESGLKYDVDLSSGQKTGFYIDQRENRRISASHFAGRRVLDVCCYSGGFGLSAVKLGGAAHVLGIDTSAQAIDLARHHAELNGVSAAMEFRQGDMFDTLEAMRSAGEKFGGVVLDPPKFARKRSGIEQALKAYHQLNRVGVDLLEPGGILVTCSCSGNVQEGDFAEMLFGVANRTSRTIQVLRRLGAAADHPTALSCPETEYLKCFVCRVI